MLSTIVDKNTKVVVQGITGHQGSFHTGEMLKFGTNVVAGVSPGKKGTEHLGIPVFDTVADAVSSTGADASMISVPAAFTKDAAYEAIDAGVKLVYILTEKVPFHDTLQIYHQTKIRGIRLLGPNGPGITRPGVCKIGIMPNQIFRKGDVAVASRSGTLTYEIVNAITEDGFGESTVIGLGGDPVVGMSFIDALEGFYADPDTKRIVLVGEIGGNAEEKAAEYITEQGDKSKKVVAYIAGRSAPKGKRMGHAGAIIERGMGTAESKVKAFTEAGVKVADYPDDVPKLLR